MRAAIAAAKESSEQGDYAVGSAIVLDNQVIAASGNRTHLDTDPTQHAEMIVIRAAAKALGKKNLSGCILYD
jgi:tRNA(Arg) A34 adenosine deaminase TadA